MLRLSKHCKLNTLDGQYLILELMMDFSLVRVTGDQRYFYHQLVHLKLSLILSSSYFLLFQESKFKLSYGTETSYLYRTIGSSNFVRFNHFYRDCF